MKTLKRFVFYTVIFLAANSLTACFFNLDDFGDCVSAQNNVRTESRNISSFDGIQSEGDFEVYVQQGNTTSCQIEASSNLFSYIRTEVRNGTLYIYSSKCFKNSTVRIYLTTDYLRAVTLSGSGYIRGENRFSSSNMNITLSGSGRIDMLVDAQRIDANNSGSGSVILTGASNSVNFNVSGSGSLKAVELFCQTAYTSVSGSGLIELSVERNLEAFVSGSGTIRYRGNPTITSRITGSGRVLRW